MSADKQPTAAAYWLPNVERPQLGTVVHKRLKRSLRIQVAVEADYETIKRYMRYEQLPSNGLLLAGGKLAGLQPANVQISAGEDLTSEAAAADMDRMVELRLDVATLRDGLVTLVSDGGLLVGMLCEKIVERQPPNVIEAPATLPDDLSSLIDEARSSWRTIAAAVADVGGGNCAKMRLQF